MADQEKLNQAAVYAYVTLCSALDSKNWKYERHDQDLKITCSATGDDLPMELVIKVDPTKQMVTLLSHLPFTVPEDKRLDAAVAVSLINNCLVDGCFDFDIAEGHIFFRMSNSFIESQLSETVFLYLLFCSCQTIDEYNDKLLMLVKGMITIEKFIEVVNN
ncbi:MAG: hypothetical protein IJ315_02515 [Firmicutes bacterium]|nr:hypothetical protein [Bacillota bacterium]